MPRILALLSLLLFPFAATAHASEVFVTLEGFERAPDGESGSWLLVVRNHSGRDITDVDVDIHLAAAGGSVSAAPHPAWQQVNWSCAQLTGSDVRCRLPLLPGTPGAFVPLVVTVATPRETRLELTAHATWRDGAGNVAQSAPARERLLFQRQVPVTNTSDAGPGSLRAAIEYANDTCARDLVPCAIAFRIAGPAGQNGWHTIRPLTPLPAITAPDVTISRDAGARYPVELDGSLLATGHGLDVAGEGPWLITDLAIGGFPWDGIHVTRRGPVEGAASSGISGVLVGVRPDHSPNGNGSRGITFDAPASGAAVYGSSIRANARSGVFIAGAKSIGIFTSAIGGFSEPRFRNGGSGIFVGPGSSDIEISGNGVQGNRDFGIASARGAVGVDIVNSMVTGNGIFDIDHGLDGFSGYVQNGSDPRNAHLPAPRIVSWSFDEAAYRTTYSGTFDAPVANRTWVLTVVSPAPAWPEMSLPRFEFTGTTFSFTHFGPPGDVRVTVGSADESDGWSTSEPSQ